MKQLTKKERNELYKTLLEKAIKETEFDFYICNEIKKIIGAIKLDNLTEFGHELNELAPENYLCEPLYTSIAADCYNDGVFLKNRHEVRITMLMFAIEMTNA